MRGRERLDSRGSVSAPPQVRKRLADLKPKLNKPEEPVKQPVIGVLLNVKEKAEIQLLVSYIVSNASWTPKYDLRVSSKERTMEVRAGEGGRRGGREGGGGHLSLTAVVVCFLCRLATLGWSSRTLGKTGEPFCVCPLLLFLLLLLLLLILLLLLLLLILPPLPPLCIPTGWMPGSPSPQPRPASEAPPQNWRQLDSTSSQMPTLAAAPPPSRPSQGSHTGLAKSPGPSRRHRPRSPRASPAQCSTLPPLPPSPRTTLDTRYRALWTVVVCFHCWHLFPKYFHCSCTCAMYAWQFACGGGVKWP